jgi:hypothetical protein
MEEAKLRGMYTSWIWSQGSHSQTWSIDFPPQYVLAINVISKFGGGGVGNTGILSYRIRNPDGSDSTVPLASQGQGNTPTSFQADQVTNIVFEVWTSDAFAYATPMVTFW